MLDMLLKFLPVLAKILELMFKKHQLRLAASRRKFFENVVKHDELFRRQLMKIRCRQRIIAPRIRRLKSHKRFQNWWKNLVEEDFCDREMLANFRITRKTYLYLVEKLWDELKPSQNAFGPCLSVHKIVAIALFKLSSTAEYRVVGIAFGVHKNTVKKCVYRVCDAINKVLFAEEIRFPAEEEALNIAAKFESKTGFGPIIGSIDATHIPILPPSNGYRDYVNRKGWPSLVLQAVVDSNLLFRDISVRHPGSVHDATVLKDSFLYKNIENMMPKISKNVAGIRIPPIIIDDPAYPLLPWLLKGYTPARCSEQEFFNTQLNKGRVVVEQAFGRLKARWRCLSKRIDIYHKFVPYVVSACCVLHNLAERNKEPFNEQWLYEAEILQQTNPQPQSINSNELLSLPGDVIRNHLKNVLSTTPP